MCLCFCSYFHSLYSQSNFFFFFFSQEHAFETSQKYKEGKFIIELAHMIKDNGWEQQPYLLGFLQTLTLDNKNTTTTTTTTTAISEPIPLSAPLHLLTVFLTGTGCYLSHLSLLFLPLWSFTPLPPVILMMMAGHNTSLLSAFIS